MVWIDKELKDNVKLKQWEKQMDKIQTWINNNFKCKNYIGCICFSYIQHKFQSIRTE